MIAEELPDGRRQIQFGHACDSHDGLAQSFETAKLTPYFPTMGSTAAASLSKGTCAIIS